MKADRAAVKLVIGNHFGQRRGGAENMLWYFLRHLDRRRLDPVVVFTNPGPFEREVQEIGLRTVLLPTPRLRQVPATARSVARLAHLLSAEKPDLVLSWMPEVHLHMAPAAILAGIPRRLVWFQHYWPNARHWLDRAPPLLPARAVGCCSEAVAGAMLWPRHRTFVVNPGIEARPVPTPAERLLARRAIGIPGDRFLIGVVGRLEPLKRQDLFLRVLAALLRRGHQIHGLIVGGEGKTSSGYEGQLRELASSLGLETRVTFTGHVEDAMLPMQAMDVLVNVSTQEGFGLTLLEAMAVGVPVVAFANGGPADMIENGVSGLLVPSGDESALTDRLHVLLQEQQFRERLARGGLDRFHSRYSAEIMAETFHRQLEGVAGHRAA
jgi:glycosyltransferase involved in cell wall biosynthesis